MSDPYSYVLLLDESPGPTPDSTTFRDSKRSPVRILKTPPRGDMDREDLMPHVVQRASQLLLIRQALVLF